MFYSTNRPPEINPHVHTIREKDESRGEAKYSRNLVIGPFKVAEVYLEKEWLTALQRSY
jgi:hypothetical protein